MRPAGWSAVRLPLLVAVGLLVAGALAGALWWALWTPPSGVALNGGFVLDSEGAHTAFDATGAYVVIALVVGLVAGVVAGWTARRDELAVLGVTTVAAVAAGFLMYGVGHLLGPGDPNAVAADLADYEPLRGDLTVAGTAPLLALPGGALVGLVVTLLGFARSQEHGSGADGGAHLDWRRRRAEPGPGPDEQVPAKPGAGPA